MIFIITDDDGDWDDDDKPDDDDLSFINFLNISTKKTSFFFIINNFS